MALILDSIKTVLGTSSALHQFFIVILLWNFLEVSGLADQLFSFPISPDHVMWNSYVLRAIPSIQEYLNYTNNEDILISDICKQHFQLYTNALTIDQAPWALQMFDSSTKIPESVASGAVYHLGNFDQCLDVKAHYESGQYAFNGQYCGTEVKLSNSGNFSLFLQIASCIPSTCSSAELQIFLQNILNSVFTLDDVNVLVEVSEDNCYIKGDKPPLDAASWVVISILIILCIQVILSTVCDAFKLKSSYKTVNVFINSFSLLQNLKLLMTTGHARGSIKNMHGLRAISILWVILGHRFNRYDSSLPLINKSDLVKTYDNMLMQLIMNAMPSVDTFFFMSGFLVCYLLMKDLNKGNKFNPVIYYVHRYLRLSTSYALVIAFYATLLGDIGYGPTWRKHVKDQTQICKDTWWSALLYIDNYVQLDKYASQNRRSVCMSTTWYLTCDMQFAWVAPMILLPLYYWPKWTLKMIVLLILASCFAPFTSTYLNQFYMTDYILDKSPAHKLKFMLEIYVATYMRATPYLMGICLGYYMFKNSQDINLPKFSVTCGWITSTVIACVVIFSPTMMYQSDYEYDALGSAFYAGFHRLAWSLVIGWIILACHYGYGGPVDTILSWGGWLPLSRLSYCIYLVHTYIMYIDIIQVRTLIYFDHFSAVQRYFSDIIFSVMLSSVLNLLIESPTLGLLREFLKKTFKK